MFLVLVFSLLSVTGCKSAIVEGSVTGDQMKEQNPAKTDIMLWLTNPTQSILFQRQNFPINFSGSTNNYPTIIVDSTETHQTIDGFGFALTGSSALLINNLHSEKKEALLKNLFLTDSTGIGLSYLRISIGASDLSPEVFTYNETTDGKRDDSLQYFSLAKDNANLIPVLKEIIKLNPSIKILATPWTAPTWMKTNHSYSGGSLRPDCYDVYARYFVKYIQSMQEAGITIDAITPQNEPLNAYNNPAMLMSATEQANFIKNYLGPQFLDNHLKTKIIIYDHNLDHPEYAIDILNDPEAAKYIDGSAFHLYAGTIETMSKVKSAHPEKNLYFTEQYTAGNGSFAEDFAWHVKNLIIGATRNNSRNVIEWNLASDPTLSMHTPGGCNSCLGALTISADAYRNVSYYIIAHASKFVRSGAVRIGSNIVGDLQNVAFKNPDGQKILIVLNTGKSPVTFNIGFNNKTGLVTLAAGSAGTFVWK
ncbi:glucosylceramidase [Paludibacter jiangxiensis]|uniref:Glucosylceramidase n=2 Tax=Paludibacter jiangxiensis TaxID=681398 RepID=A0A170YE92_9BACT|nr:glucosylceramidase [Paludibacter jiangxiensis]